MTVGREQFMAMAAGVVLCAPVVASACVLDAPVCEVSNGRYASANLHSVLSGGDFAYFDEGPAGGDTDAIYLVDCASRSGVKVDIPPATGYLNEAADKAHDYIDAAVTSSKKYTLTRLRNGLRNKGLTAELITLPAGHCGCELPKMPFVGCGDAP